MSGETDRQKTESVPPASLVQDTFECEYYNPRVGIAFSYSRRT